MEDLVRDLRLAVRALARERGFVLASVVALALGVGGSTAVFSVVEAVLLRPLPFAAPERLVAIWDVNAARGADHVTPSPGNFLDWERETGTFESTAIWYSGRGTYRGGGEPAVVRTVKATPGFFDVVGVRVVAGRAFHRGELRGAVYNVAEQNLGGDRELVLGEGFWRRTFGGDAAVVGSTISLDGAEWRVLGVVSDELDVLTSGADVYVPWDVPASYAKFPAGTPRDFRFVNVVARLADGVTLEAARARMSTLAASLAAAHPKENAGWSVALVPLADELRGPVRAPLLLLFGATGFVLLVACLDVAGLQIARAAARERERAVKAALGASSGQLFRGALTEAALLALLGAAAGVAVAHAALSLLLALQPWELRTASPPALDARALLFALAAAAGTALVCAAAPLASRAASPLAALLAAGGRAGAGRERRRLRRALVALQVAATLVLLTGAGLFLRSFARARAVRPGFDARGVLVARISLDKASYMTAARSADFYAALVAKLEAIPGVVSAGGATALPMSTVGVDFARPFWKDGEPDPGGQAARAAIRMVTPRYFETMRMPLLAGRAFTPADRLGAPKVIAVNETLARRTFGAESPIGRRLVIDYKGGAYPYEIVALVADVRFAGLKSDPIPELFIPHLQNPYLDLNVAVRTRGEPAALTAAVRRAVRELDPAQPVHSIVTLESLAGETIAADRFLAALFACLAGVALVLAATGVYGLLAYLVRRRAHELGVRQALGARPSDVTRLVLGESARLALAGAAAGLALSLALGRLARGLLYGIAPGDPVTLVAVAALLAVVVFAASAVPARAASRVPPLEAMRGE